MPIVDFDADAFAWFAMPLAEGALDSLACPVDVDELKAVLRDAAAGLLAAHTFGFVHRDIKPSNILKLIDADGERWVVADWGIVRRPEGQTTANDTLRGAVLGTEGFAPPEAYSDAHAASFAWDSYSLGRVAAWATTGTWPTPLVDLGAPEPWRRFVRLATDADAGKRPQAMNRVLELLDLLGSEVPAVPGIPNETLSAAKDGDVEASVVVLQAAQHYSDDGAFFIDELAEISGQGLDEFVRRDPTVARDLVLRMEYHLEHEPWGRRDFNHYNVPLHWIQRVAEAAADSNLLDLLEDACAALFRQDPLLDRYLQTKRSRQWIASVRGPAAARVAQILREYPAAAKHYGELRHAEDQSIRTVLLAANAG